MNPPINKVKLMVKGLIGNAYFAKMIDQEKYNELIDQMLDCNDLDDLMEFVSGYSCLRDYFDDPYRDLRLAELEEDFD